jgi:hypothetical protein
MEKKMLEPYTGMVQLRLMSADDNESVRVLGQYRCGWFRLGSDFPPEKPLEIEQG